MAPAGAGARSVPRVGTAPVPSRARRHRRREQAFTHRRPHGVHAPGEYEACPLSSCFGGTEPRLTVACGRTDRALGRAGSWAAGRRAGREWGATRRVERCAAQAVDRCHRSGGTALSGSSIAQRTPEDDTRQGRGVEGRLIPASAVRVMGRTKRRSPRAVGPLPAFQRRESEPRQVREMMVAQGRIELPTLRFSIACSTN